MDYEFGLACSRISLKLCCTRSKLFIGSSLGMIAIFMVLFYRATVAERKLAEEEDAKRKARPAAKKADTSAKKEK